MATQKTLTIFGCGYIGTPIAVQAIQKGYYVTALTRNDAKLKELNNLGIQRTIHANVQDADWHTMITEDQDCVLNCVSAADHSLQGYRTSYVDGQRSILEWAKTISIGRYIYTSSTGVYPQCNGETVNEESTTEGASPTGKILLDTERLVQDSPALKHWVILRLAGIYGPGRSYLLNKLKAGDYQFPTSGEEFINYIHRDDITSTILTLFQTDLSAFNQIYNLSDGNPLRKKDFVLYLAKQLEVDASKIIFEAKEKSKMNKKVDNSKLSKVRGIFLSQGSTKNKN